MKFMKIGGKFSISTMKEAWAIIVVSDEAFFLIPGVEQSSGGVGAGHAIAGAVQEASAKALKKTESEFKTLLQNLQDDVAHPDWPVEKSGGMVFRIPKDACTGLKYSVLSGITLKTEERKFKIAPTAGFFPKGTKQFLSDHGWLAIGK